MPIDEVYIVATKEPFFPSAKLRASLSSFYVPRKLSQVATDYIPPRDIIENIDISNIICSESSIFIVATRCVEKD